MNEERDGDGQRHTHRAVPLATLDLLKDKTGQPLERDTAGRASDWVPRHGC